jgi:hypothetical protein
LSTSVASCAPSAMQGFSNGCRAEKLVR